MANTGNTFPDGERWHGNQLDYIGLKSAQLLASRLKYAIKTTEDKEMRVQIVQNNKKAKKIK